LHHVFYFWFGGQIEKAERRLQQVLKLDVMPMAMLFNKAEGKDDRSQWIKFQREYANRIIVGSKLTAARTAAQQEARHCI